MEAQTFEGIDTCGARVAEEVKGYIEQHPSLNRISVIGHSMGGLIARYLIGRQPSSPIVASFTSQGVLWTRIAAGDLIIGYQTQQWLPSVVWET